MEAALQKAVLRPPRCGKRETRWRFGVSDSVGGPVCIWRTTMCWNRSRWIVGLIAMIVLAARGNDTDAAGLLAPTDLTLPPLRVTEHLVDVAIHDQIALTKLSQTFHNDTTRRLEA